MVKNPRDYCYYESSPFMEVDSTTQYAEASTKEEKEFLSLCTIVLHLLGGGGDILSPSCGFLLLCLLLCLRSENYPRCREPKIFELQGTDGYWSHPTVLHLVRMCLGCSGVRL